MPKIVMKFGGTSVADMSKINAVANIIKYELSKGNEIIVVVSAMAGQTNDLTKKVESIGPLYDAREYSAVVSTGENVTSGLLAIMLQQMSINARSWQGWQIPINTSDEHSAARVLNIDTINLLKKFAEGMEVAVVSGFQGLGPDGRITTLGRGGSDTSAVALAAAFKAERCDIFTDVDGVYTTDPRVCNKARKLDKISYEEMLELASLGAKVLQTRSVELATRYKVRLRVLSSFIKEFDEKKGTLVCSEGEIVENKVIAGVAFSRDEAKLTVTGIEDRPGIAANIFGKLADQSVNVDMIVQNVSENGLTDMTFSCPVDQVARAKEALKKDAKKNILKYRQLLIDEEIAKVSIVGIGMKTHAGIAKMMFESLAKESINIIVISTSEIKISVLISRKYLELAVQTLHDTFELEKV
jgi:aspartate kinase